jgi:O-antigen/teichoic acid export membrane protein
MGLIFGLSEILIRIIQFIFVKKLMPQISISLRNVDFKLLRKMLVYGVNTLSYSMGALIIYKASDIIIGIFMSTAHVARFYVTTAAVLLLSQLLRSFTAAIKPAVSDLDARNDKSRLHEISFLTQKYTLLLLIPSVCFLVVMGREFLFVWVGAKFSKLGVVDELSVVLAILAIGHGLRLSQHSNFMVLVGKGDHEVFGILTVISAVLCVALSILSVKVLNLGLLGIAWSNFIPMAIISAFILPLYFNWKMQISLRESIKQVWCPALLGSLPTIAMISIWKYLYPPVGWFNIAMVVVSAILLTALGSWFFSFSELEQKRFLRILERK